MSKSFIFSGTLTLSGVTFFIEADDLAEARLKADLGEWYDYDTNVADSRDWKIDPKTGTLNE